MYHFIFRNSKLPMAEEQDEVMNAMIDAKVKLATAQAVDEALKKRDAEYKKTKKFSRDLKIQQIKESYNNANDKRVMEFLLQAKFDLEDLDEKLSAFYNAEAKEEEGEQLVKNADNVELVKEFILQVGYYGNMTKRKLDREIESYKIAKKAGYGWGTVAKYREHELFEKEDDDTPFYELPEPTDEEKLKKLRTSRNEDRKERSGYRNYNYNRGARRGNNFYKPKFGGHYRERRRSYETEHSGARARPNHFPKELEKEPVVPQRKDRDQCFNCGSRDGHIARFCPHPKRT